MSELFYVDRILLLVIVLTLIAGFLVHKLFTRNFDYWKKKGVPYVTPKPIVGNFANVLSFKMTIGHSLWDMYNKMDAPFFGMWVFHKPHLVAKSPELIKQILVKDFKYFCDRNVPSCEKADPIAAHALFFVKNPEWRQIRSKMTPVFTSGKIKNMIPIMNEVGESLKAYLAEMSVRNRSLEAKEICAKFSTDVIASCAFGLTAHSFEYEDAPFRVAGRDLFDFNFANATRILVYFFAPSLVNIFRINFVPSHVAKFLTKAFWNTISERELNDINRNDLIDIIIKLKREDNIDGVQFEGNRVVAQAVQFFLAGFETTSSIMAFTLYELCLHNTIQQKVRAEIKFAIQEHEGITYEAIQSMKYLDMIFSETLRKYPVLGFLDRRCMEDYKIPGSNVVLEKGTPVFIPTFGLHYDPKYFPDPQKFDPERFSEENINSRPNCIYMPFGHGPRNCVGERFGLTAAKLGLIHIISQFEVERSDDTPVPLKFATKALLLTAENGVPMHFHRY